MCCSERSVRRECDGASLLSRPMIQCAIAGLERRFGQQSVVTDVSLDIAKGEFLVILGPSGCGKTTTLRMIAGLEVPDAGTIQIGGAVVSDASRKHFVRPEHRGVGMVFQSYAVWPHMTVFDNVAYPLRVRRWKKQKLRARVAEVLELVGLGNEGARPATALSGGQMQRVALARALVFDPALLLFDEPLSNLDLKLRERLRVELKELQRRSGITSVYVTHDQTEAVELGDRVVVMQSGRVVQAGPPAELYQEPRTRFVAEFIGSANICGGTVVALEGNGAARVCTAHGASVAGSMDGSIAVGDAVDIVVHPEDCRLTPANGHVPEGGFPVRVLERRYQGVVTRYMVDWEGEKFDVVALGTASQIDTGVRAVMWIDRSRLMRRVP